MKSLNMLLTLLFILLVFTSCSKNANPVAPGNSDSDMNPVIIADSQLPVNDFRGVFGAWQVNIDTKTLTAEIIPARNAHAIGDIFDADLLQFLTVQPCANCMRITNIDIDNQWFLNVGIGIKHPFADLSSRPDLHGFDVRLIFLQGAFVATFTNILTMLPDGTEEEVELAYYNLVNADGYTSHFDSIVTDERYFINGADVLGNVNPFLRYFNSYGTDTFDPHVPTGHNVMPVGSSMEVKTAQLGNWGFDQLTFYLVADVAYGHSATYLDRPNPQYFLPEYNRTEPWRIEYWVENNNLDSADPLSTADAMIQVFDWQHGATVDPDYPNLDNLSGISKSSNVSQLELSIPGFQDAPIIVDTPESGTGGPQDPLTYRMVVTNENGYSNNAIGLLAVRDELYGQTGRLAIPESPSGFPYETEDILDYTFYQVLTINNPGATYDYDSELFIEDDDLFASYGDTYIFAEFFMDPGGRRFQYRWDYDYDGVTFDVDGSGNPSPRIEFTKGGEYNVGLRIRTNSKPAREYIYTLPVVSDGDVFQSDIDSTVVTKRDNTSVNRAAALGWSSDYYYCAFTSEAGTKRDVWLAVGNSDGFFTPYCITGTISEDCFNPTLEVIENGVNDRLVVVFNAMNGANWDMYSTWGNLDGSNFLPAHVTQFATTTDYSSFADTIYKYNKLFAYYWTWDFMSPDQNIEIAYSEDYGETWIMHPTMLDDTSHRKYEPSVAYVVNNSRTYVVWEDFRNMGTTGTDIYIAESYGGLTFEPPINLTNFSGTVNEKDPEAVSFGQKIAIAYLADPEATGKNNLYIKLHDIYQTSDIDFRIQHMNFNSTHCMKPSIGMALDNKMVVGYCTYNSGNEELTSYVLEVEAFDGFFDFRETSIYNEIVGTIPSAALNYYPGSAVICRNFNGNDAYETFAVWTKFDDSWTLDDTPFPMYMGDIESIAVVERAD